jgi:hypothetical protein
VFIDQRDAPEGPRCFESVKVWQSLPLVIQKHEKISNQTIPKDAQKHFLQLMDKVKSYSKNF